MRSPREQREEMATNGFVHPRRVSRPAASRLNHVPQHDSVTSCRYSSTDYRLSRKCLRRNVYKGAAAVNSRAPKKVKRSSPFLGAEAPSDLKSLSLSTYASKHVHDRWASALRRPRTSWGKPHASYRKLVSVFKDGSANGLANFYSPVEKDSLDRETVVFVPSFLSGNHGNCWRIPSSTSSSQEPFNTHLLPLSQSSSEATVAECSPSSCSEEDFCSSDAMSFVMQDDCYDSVLNFMPTNNEGILCEAASTYMAYAGDEMRRSEGEVEASIEITSAEEYRIDLSDFEPEENAVEVTEEKIKRGLSLRLDYEDVLKSWSDRSWLWADGKRPITSCSLPLS